jgi:hypothetical protein
VLDAVEKSQQHYYKLTNAHTRESLVVELGMQIKPIARSTTPGDVEDILQKYEGTNGNFL